MLLAPLNRGTLAEGLAPAGTLAPYPPLPPVGEVDRAGGRREHEPAGGVFADICTAEVGGVERAFSHGHIASFCNKLCELGVCHGVLVDLEGGDGALMHGAFFGIKGG